MKLSPNDFWSMSVIEWNAACAGAKPRAPLPRADFEQMMKAYPDEQ
ncbi:MAG: phage tail assembly chaperone [Proteobacteria bacterium]|nr:phage tail assembly chaperone [Pseudomonadota bacterium]